MEEMLARYRCQALDGIYALDIWKNWVLFLAGSLTAWLYGQGYVVEVFQAFGLPNCFVTSPNKQRLGS